MRKSELLSDDDLLELGLVYHDNERAHDGYAWQRSVKDADFQRLLNGQAYWPEEQYQPVLKFKKIILNFWPVLIGESENTVTWEPTWLNKSYKNNLGKLPQYLMKRGFQLLIRSEPGIFRPIDEESQFSEQLQRAQLLNNSDLIAELGACNKEVQEYAILDAQDAIHLRKKVEIFKSKNDDDEYHLVFGDARSLTLRRYFTPAQIRDLHLGVDTDSLSSITYSLDFDTDKLNPMTLAKTTLTWSGEFDSKNLQKLLILWHQFQTDARDQVYEHLKEVHTAALASELDGIFLSKLSTPHTPSHTLFSTNLFSHLKELELLFPELEQSAMISQGALDFDTHQLPKLRILRINNFYFQKDLSFLIYFRKLTELILENCPNLTFPIGSNHLKRLSLHGNCYHSVVFLLANNDLFQELKYISIDCEANNPIDFNITHLALCFAKLKQLYLSNFPGCDLLTIRNNPKLKEVQLASLKNCRELSVSNCKELSGIYTYSLNAFQKLTVTDCEKIYAISISMDKPIDGANNLGVKKITLKNCPQLTKLIIWIDDAIEIDITNCPNLNVESLVSAGFVVQLDQDYRMTLFRPQGKVAEQAKDKSLVSTPLTIINSTNYQTNHFEAKIPSELISENTTAIEEKRPASIVSELEKIKENNPNPLKPYQTKTESYSFDANTASPEGNLVVDKIFHVRGENKTLECPVNHYRIKIYGSLRVDENERIYADPIEFDESELELVSCEKPLSNLPIYDCIFPIHIKKDKWTPLPGLSANDRLLEMQNPNLLIARAKTTGQYWVKLKSDAGFLYNGPCQFAIQKDPNYLCEKIIGKIDDRLKIPPLPPKILKIFNEFMAELRKDSLVRDIRKRKFSKAHHVFFAAIESGKKQLLTKAEIANSIATFCRSFASENLDKNGDTDLENFRNLLFEGKGVCQHRGQVYMALCHYFRIPARMIGNQCHMFDETPVQVNDQSPRWHALDLGGGNIKIDERVLYQPQAKQSAQEQSTNPEKSASKLSLPSVITADQKIVHDEKEIKQNTQTQDKEASIDLWEERLIGEPSWMDTCHTFQEFVHHVIKEKNPLVRIRNKKDIFMFDELVAQSLETKGEEKENHDDEKSTPHISLFSAAEIQSKFNATKIVENDCLEIAGPLQDMAQGTYGPGVVIAFWSQFTPHQQLVLKTMMDDPPTLNNVPIDKRVTVLGVLENDEPTSEVFLSRATEIVLPKKFSPARQALPERSWLIDARTDKSLIPNDVGIRTIDLYHSKDWHSLLVEQLMVENDSFIFKPGPLLESMNSLLIIKNAPMKDPAFKLFWHQFTTANGKILLHDEWYIPGKNFKIVLTETQSFLAKSLMVYYERPSAPKGTVYVINRENYPQLFSMQHIDPLGKVHPAPGILERYRNGDQIIFQDASFEKDSPELQHQLQHVSDEIEKLKAQATENIEYHVYVEAEAEEEKQKDLRPPLQNNQTSFIETHDEMFVIDELMRTQNLSAENIYHLGNQSAWSALIEQVTYEKIKEPNGHVKIHAHRIEIDFLQKLKKGETVVISGGLSLENYLQLQTLFCEKPYLMVNGVREDITGKVIWVYPEQKWQPPLPHVVRKPVIKEYEDRLCEELKLTDREVVDKVSLYFKYFEDFEKEKKLTYSQFKAMVISAQEDLTRENPIKPVIQFHYDKDTEKYAYLNVLAKLMFSKTEESHVRIDKLNKILENINKDPKRFNEYFWRLANCFSGKTLREFFYWQYRPFLAALFKNGPEIFSQEIKNLCKFNESSIPIKKLTPSQTSYEKQKERLLSACKDTNKRIIFTRGQAGTGKTEAVNFLQDWLNKRGQETQVTYGLKNIAEWLTPAPENVHKKLVLDEVDLKQPGTWARLLGLLGHPPAYRDDQGKCHTLSERHQVIAIGNPPNYVNRKFHKELWEHTTTIWFSPFSETVVRQKIEDYLNKNKIKPIKSLIDFIFKCYEYLRANELCIAKVTMGRDLKNLVARLSVFIEESDKKNLSDDDILNLARRAAYEEFSGILPLDKARTDFSNFLELKDKDLLPNPQDPIVSLGDLKITPEKMATLNIIRHHIAIHKKRILSGDDTLGKAGLLVEGPSGIGKSSMVLALLQSLGYTPDNIDSQKRVYYISAGSQNAEHILRQAFQEGATVVYDELNYDFSVHELLNHYLTGVDEKNNKPEKIGFTLIATQNSGYKSLPEDLLSRLHKTNMNGFSDDELIRLAKEYRVEGLAQAYLNLHKEKHPGINPRRFFGVAKEYSPVAIPSQEITLQYELTS